MNSLYRYSPIASSQTFDIAVDYVVQQTSLLSYKITGYDFPLASLTVFTHYTNEFEFLSEWLLTQGKLLTNNNGPYVQLRTPLQVQGKVIEHLRVRAPDPYRMQVGCNDFVVPNYQVFKNQFLEKSKNLRLIERQDYDMIEFFDPDFDVLAYVLSK